jgi:hypothetical protein
MTSQNPPTTITIYVRKIRWYGRLLRWLAGKPGNGSLERPYAKLRHAMRDVPLSVPPNTHYSVDVTGLEGDKA